MSSKPVSVSSKAWGLEKTSSRGCPDQACAVVCLASSPPEQSEFFEQSLPVAPNAGRLVFPLGSRLSIGRGAGCLIFNDHTPVCLVSEWLLISA